MGRAVAPLRGRALPRALRRRPRRAERPLRGLRRRPRRARGRAAGSARDARRPDERGAALHDAVADVPRRGGRDRTAARADRARPERGPQPPRRPVSLPIRERELRLGRGAPRADGRRGRWTRSGGPPRARSSSFVVGGASTSRRSTRRPRTATSCCGASSGPGLDERVAPSGRRGRDAAPGARAARADRGRLHGGPARAPRGPPGGCADGRLRDLLDRLPARGGGARSSTRRSRRPPPTAGRSPGSRCAAGSSVQGGTPRSSSSCACGREPAHVVARVDPHGNTLDWRL